MLVHFLFLFLFLFSLYPSRGTPKEKAAFLFWWCSRRKKRTKYHKVQIFVRMLGTVAMGIHPLKPDQKHLRPVCPAFVSYLASGLVEDPSFTEEREPPNSLSSPFSCLCLLCCCFLPSPSRGSIENETDSDDQAPRKPTREERLPSRKESSMRNMRRKSESALATERTKLLKSEKEGSSDEEQAPRRSSGSHVGIPVRKKSGVQSGKRSFSLQKDEHHARKERPESMQTWILREKEKTEDPKEKIYQDQV